MGARRRGSEYNFPLKSEAGEGICFNLAFDLGSESGGIPQSPCWGPFRHCSRENVSTAQKTLLDSGPVLQYNSVCAHHDNIFLIKADIGIFQIMHLTEDHSDTDN